MKKKKIVHIAQSAGGVAEYLYMLLKNIKNSEYENILIVSEQYKEQIDRFKEIVDKIYFVPMIREINIKADFKAILQVKKLIKQIKPDVVYLHSSKAGGIGRLALLFNFKTKIIYNAHGWAFNAEINGKKSKKYVIIEKILALKTDCIINISQSEYNSAIKNKIAKPDKMCVIHNCIDTKKFIDSEKYRDETRNRYLVGDDEILIGVVGRISEQKDPLTFIKAAKLVNEKYSNTKFMYVGSGILAEQVLEYAKANDFEDKVIITGWTANVEQYIPALDIAVLPSKWEGFGLAILEYMICKKPIVATNVGGIADIIKDGKNGYLTNCKDYKKLSSRIYEYIENSELVNKIVSENYDYVINEYTIDKLIKQTCELF